MPRAKPRKVRTKSRPQIASTKLEDYRGHKRSRCEFECVEAFALRRRVKPGDFKRCRRWGAYSEVDKKSYCRTHRIKIYGKEAFEQGFPDVPKGKWKPRRGVIVPVKPKETPFLYALRRHRELVKYLDNLFKQGFKECIAIERHLRIQSRMEAKRHYAETGEWRMLPWWPTGDEKTDDRS